LSCIHLIDDDLELRETLAAALISRGYETAVYGSAEEFFNSFVASTPSVILVDMRMPVQSGLDLVHRAKQNGVCSPVIFLSGETSAPEAVEAMKAGAVDFIFKPASLATILRAIDSALTAHRDASRHQLAEQQFRSRYKSLTPRERELCAFIARGEKIKAIAAALGISEPTVKIHKARVLRKIGATSVTDLALNLSRFGADSP
jgi:FixJ family two-component response regulator